MSNIINILPDFIANQIAAGEVVQRPESVVKELVENSLDAGADNIHITIRDAGKSLIHIIDNGSGMSKVDLELSIRRHATSKILSNKDLEAIKSFGFRGEALASISAIAKIEILSKQRNEKLGWKLTSEPNKSPIIEPVDTPEGTQILVKNLFFNTPARRKFLRANLTEYRHILDTINKFALGENDLSLSFYDDNNLIYNLKPQARKDRVKQILGKKIEENLNPVEFKNDVLRITGFVASPNVAKVSRSGQYLFLNKRSISNRSLSHAITSAYGPLLEKSQHPIFVIYLEIDPEEVDINVHPQKHEVKFEDERVIYNSLKQAIQQTLRSNNLTSEYVFRNQQAQYPFENNQIDNEKVIINKQTGEIIPEKVSYQQTNTLSHSSKTETDFSENFKHQTKEPANKKDISAFEAIFSDSLFDRSDNKDYFQVHNKYIITQIDGGILVIDQHNAHERINYEKALKMIDRELSRSQEMLFPENFELSNHELSLLQETQQELTNLGFKFKISGNSINIFAKPADVQSGKEEEDLKEILSLYEENREIGRTDKRDNIAASYSCRSAIKTGKKLSLEEMKDLHKQLMRCNTPEVCPHGRPVIVEITIKELDLQFGRTPSYKK